MSMKKSGKMLLEIKRVFHYYGKARSLEEVNLEVEEGKLTAVIGPNGAGKSTLLKVISGMEEPDRGKVIFQGKRIDGMKAYKITKLGILQCPERRRLFPNMTVLENLMMGAYTMKDRSIRSRQLKLVYDMFPRLEERKKQKAGTLSGGEQQMVAIGRAIMPQPKLLLLDEPSLGLAPKFKYEIFDAIDKVKEMGTTTLLIEQDAALTMEHADMICVLEEGKVEMRGTPEQLAREPRIKKVYLGI
ncbi:MAG: ABC transporter ATP-binding protein [Promethearchaeota archaeon]